MFLTPSRDDLLSVARVCPRIGRQLLSPTLTSSYMPRGSIMAGDRSSRDWRQVVRFLPRSRKRYPQEDPPASCLVLESATTLDGHLRVSRP